MAHFEALLGIIASDGVALELEGTLNFTGGLRAVNNANNESIDVTSTGDFSNQEAGGGNPTQKVAAERTAPITGLPSGTFVRLDFDLIPDNATLPVDGYYQIYVITVVKKVTALTYHRVGAVIDAKFDAAEGTPLITVGSQVTIDAGDATGFTLTLTEANDTLRATLDNASGETVTGYGWIGWLRTDLIP